MVRTIRVITKDNKSVIITHSKTIHFDLPEDAKNNLKHEIDFVLRHNNFVNEHTIKNEISQLVSKDKHGNDIHEHGKQ